MGNFLAHFALAVFTLLGLLSCGDGLYQQAPEGVASSRTRAYLYVGHSESISFTGKGLKGARFTITPDLPAGLSLDEELPGIVGTPTTAQVLTEYSVHVDSDFGQTDFSMAIKVNLSSPSPLNLGDIFAAGSSSPVIFGNLDEEIIFAADDVPDGREVWKTDGTVSGTVQVRDIDPAVGVSSSPYAVMLPFFGADGGGGTFDLYFTDGTTVGTTMVSAHDPEGMARAGTRVVFSGNDSLGVGVEPFGADLADGGNVANLMDISAAGDSSPEFFVTLGSQVLFFASDGAVATGKELYVSDGTPAGTNLVLDINPGAGDSVGGLAGIAFGGYVYFGADDGTNGIELWRSNGTAAGTTLVKDIAPGAISSDPGNFAIFNGVLYFTADDNTSGLELWRTDGTAAGTYMLKDINTGGGSNTVLYPSAADDVYMYFTANDGIYGEELWRTDGTAAGTVLVKDIVNGAGSSTPLHLRMVSQTLFFSATTAANGRELWKSSGTSASTVLAADLTTGAADGIQPSASFFEFEGVLYFAGATAAVDTELFKVTPF